MPVVHYNTLGGTSVYLDLYTSRFMTTILDMFADVLVYSKATLLRFHFTSFWVIICNYARFCVMGVILQA